MKHIRIFSVFLLLALLFSIAALADTSIVQKTDAFYVADYADVLSDETEQYIIEVNAALERNCKGAQIVVVTINFLNDLDSEQYAYQVMNQWGVGDSNENNGAVLLLVPGEGKFWLTTGYGIETYFTSRVLNQILDDDFAADFDLSEFHAFCEGQVYPRRRFQDSGGAGRMPEAAGYQEKRQGICRLADTIAPADRFLASVCPAARQYRFGGGRGSFRIRPYFQPRTDPL